MADLASILAKVRALGSDIVIEDGALTIQNGALLSDDQRNWIAAHRSEIEAHLSSSTTGELPPTSEDDTPPLTWGQMARILYAEAPHGMDPFDWSYFVTEGGKIVRRYCGVGE